MSPIYRLFSPIRFSIQQKRKTGVILLIVILLLLTQSATPQEVHGTVDGMQNENNIRVSMVAQPHRMIRSTELLTVSFPITNDVFLPAVFLPQQIYFPLISNEIMFVDSHPEQGSSEQSPNTYLSWRVADFADEPLTYTVLFQADNAIPERVVAEHLYSTHLDTETLEFGTQYYWRVIATDPSGHRVIGPVWSFRTLPPIADPPDIEATVMVPAGEFKMGCDAVVSTIYPCFDWELPLHTVYLSSFRIDQYETTNIQYRTCVDAGVCNPPRRFSSAYRGNYFLNSRYDYFPVLYVSWWDAQDYCHWVGKRLPTEAEWEKAARGDGDTRTWPWGEESPNCSRLTHLPDGTRCSDTQDSQRVGSFPDAISPYGALDMAGNVFEWVQDRYNVRYYQYSPYANPPGPESGTYFSIRGGSYRDNWYYMRTTHRHYGHHGDIPFEDAPFYRSSRLGFRCARSVS